VSDFKLIRSETVRFLLGEEGLNPLQYRGSPLTKWRNTTANGRFVNIASSALSAGMMMAAKLGPSRLKK